MEHYWNVWKARVMAVQTYYASLSLRYVVAHIFEFEVFIVLWYLIGLYTRVPYINLLLTPFLYHLVMVCIAIKLFSIRLPMMTFIVMVGFAVALFGTLSGYELFVDELSNFLYLGIGYICIANINKIRSNS
jgi:hypothetical protein